MPRAYDPKAGNRAIFDALIDARDAYGAKKPVLEDQERNPLT
jgi:acyl-[acyl-carrier-protein]-phospholipid O-acyltransferase/long-chain-fatty-acid--[acyl-carrier-protein] ligase